LTATTAVAAQFDDPLPHLAGAGTAIPRCEGRLRGDRGRGGSLGGLQQHGCTSGSVGATSSGSALVETRFSTRRLAPSTRRLAGGSLIQVKGIGPSGTCDFSGEVVPPEATIRAVRRTTPLFGLGLVDAVPDTTFKSLARNQARFTPQTAGRPNMVTDVVSGKTRVGKFGWKSQVPNLMHFSGDAYLNEMGITSPLFPTENCPGGDYAAHLRPRSRSRGRRRGRRVLPRLRDAARSAPARADDAASWPGLPLRQVGCDNCHVRTLTTGASRVGALAYKTFQPYSDFPLHDMGSLGDGIEQGLATGRDAHGPLWGVHIMTSFLHDGSAATVKDAIPAHDGQGRGRVILQRVVRRPEARLLAFVNSL
jgi:CxxC motif-containing protein (DUF1111 family)